MTTNASSLEDQIAALTKVIKSLAKYVQEQYSRISRLMDKIDNAEASRVIEKAPKVHDETKTSTKQLIEDQKQFAVKELQVSSDYLILVDQLKDFIKCTIKNKLDGGTKSTLVYTKPYST